MVEFAFLERVCECEWKRPANHSQNLVTLLCLLCWFHTHIAWWESGSREKMRRIKKLGSHLSLPDGLRSRIAALMHTRITGVKDRDNDHQSHGYFDLYPSIFSGCLSGKRDWMEREWGNRNYSCGLKQKAGEEMFAVLVRRRRRSRRSRRRSEKRDLRETR